MMTPFDPDFSAEIGDADKFSPVRTIAVIAFLAVVAWLAGVGLWTVWGWVK